MRALKAWGAERTVSDWESVLALAIVNWPSGIKVSAKSYISIQSYRLLILTLPGSHCRVDVSGHCKKCY